MGTKSFSVDDVIGLLRDRAVEVDEGFCRVCSADLRALAFLRALWKLGSKAIDHTEVFRNCSNPALQDGAFLVKASPKS